VIICEHDPVSAMGIVALKIDAPFLELWFQCARIPVFQHKLPTLTAHRNKHLRFALVHELPNAYHPERKNLLYPKEEKGSFL